MSIGAILLNIMVLGYKFDKNPTKLASARVLASKIIAKGC